MKTIILNIFLILVILLYVPFYYSTAVYAGEIPTVENNTNITNSRVLSSPEEWPLMMRPGVREGNGRTLFYMDYFVPVAVTDETLFFVNPKLVWDEEYANEQNIGFGLRNLFFDDKLILGSNFYYDRKKTEYDNLFHQLGFGVEALSKWIDVRGNFYLHLSDKQETGENISYSFGSRSLIRHTPYEEPLNGLDYEGGALIPYVSNYVETKAYIGGYNYFPESGKTINGIRGRIEIRPTQMITINIEVSDDNMSSTEAYIGGYITLPFSIGDFFKGKNPFQGWKEILAFGRGPRPLRKRMTDMVIRDLDVILDTPRTEERKEHDVIFVDNSNTTGVEDGTKENPYNTVQEGVNNVVGDKWVYAQQGTGDYNENVILTNDVTLWGSGYDGGFAGISAPGNPVVDGNAAGDTVTLADRNEVMGLTIQNGGDDCIDGKNTAGTNIHHNTVTGGGQRDIELIANGGGTISDIYIMNNTMGSSGNDSIHIGVFDGSTTTDVSIIGNTVNTAGDEGIDLWFDTNTTNTNFTISNNTVDSASDNGIGIFPSGVTTVMTDFVFSNNIVSNSTGDGFLIKSAATLTNVSFGNATTGVGGYNSITGSGDLAFRNNSGVDNVKAENNYWGGGAPGASVGGTNTVDATPFLTADPNN